MAMKVDDWTVSDVTRRNADYSDRLELVSFKVSYQSCPAEQLTDVPLPKGVSETELMQWCAEDNVDGRQELRPPDQEQPVVHRSRLDAKRIAEAGLQAN